MCYQKRSARGLTARQMALACSPNHFRAHPKPPTDHTSSKTPEHKRINPTKPYLEIHHALCLCQLCCIILALNLELLTRHLVVVVVGVGMQQQQRVGSNRKGRGKQTNSQSVA